MPNQWVLDIKWLWRGRKGGYHTTQNSREMALRKLRYAMWVFDKARAENITKWHLKKPNGTTECSFHTTNIAWTYTLKPKPLSSSSQGSDS